MRGTTITPMATIADVDLTRLYHLRDSDAFPLRVLGVHEVWHPRYRVVIDEVHGEEYNTVDLGEAGGEWVTHIDQVVVCDPDNEDDRDVVDVADLVPLRAGHEWCESCQTIGCPRP